MKHIFISLLAILVLGACREKDKKVLVEFRGKTIYNDVPARTIATIWESLNERNDLQQVFCAEIKVSLN